MSNTLDGFLTVEKFLWCSSKIEYNDRTFDLVDLPRNVHGTHHTRCTLPRYYENSGEQVNMHKFFGSFNTDIKLSGMSNVASVELIYFKKLASYEHGCAPPVILVTYKVAESFTVPDFVGLRAVGEGLCIRFVPIDSNVMMSGKLQYRQLHPMHFMEPIASDTMFCLMADSQVIACHQGEIYCYSGCRSLKNIEQYANPSYRSDKKMLSWPLCEMTVDTDFLDMFRVPWITFLSNTETGAVLQIKSQDIGRFEQLAVQASSKWTRFNKPVEDLELTRRVNEAIEAENKKAVDLYNMEKTVHPELVPHGELSQSYDDELAAQKNRYQRIISRVTQQTPGYQTAPNLDESHHSIPLYMFR